MAHGEALEIKGRGHKRGWDKCSLQIFVMQLLDMTGDKFCWGRAGASTLTWTSGDKVFTQ